MRDHARILGTLFMAWGVAQFVGLIAIYAGWRDQMPAGNASTLMVVMTVLAGLIYIWIGNSVRQHDPRIRTSAILLSVLALLSFPLGTAIGIYGLWVLFGRKALTAG